MRRPGPLLPGLLTLVAACTSAAPGESAAPEDSAAPVDSAAPGDSGADSGCVDPAAWAADADGDGFGDPATVTATCTPAAGAVQDTTDCDDTTADVHPGAPETCNGRDDDCDGATDEGAESAGFADADLDGHGDPAAPLTTCAPGPGWAAAGDDCDDADAAVYPGAPDACADGVDADCSGADASCGFAGTYAVADATARIRSTTADTDLGRIVAVGDVDGDGQADVVAGTLLADGRRGGAYVLPGPLDHDADAETTGHRLTGATAGSGTGRSLSLGDLDGDGQLDVGVGAPYDAHENGLYVAFGPVNAAVNLGDAAVAHLTAPTATYGGHGSDLSGDVNGDGQADAVVGAYYTASREGSVYVAYGPVTGDVDLAAAADAVLTGEPGSVYAGRSVAAGADLDGDGVGDLVVACLGTMDAPASGGLYVVDGPVAGTVDLSAADGRHSGSTAYGYAGLWLATGDLDDDGLADVVASAYDDTLAKTGGAAYLLRGPATGTASLAAADVIVRGDVAGQYGGGVALEDVDADGVPELLLGAQGDPTSGKNGGAAFLFVRPAPGAYVFTDADAAFYAEAAGDNLGAGLTAGDVDGDGVVELVLGAPYASAGAASAGAVYVMHADE